MQSDYSSKMKDSKVLIILTFSIIKLILYEKKIRSLNDMKIRYHDSNYLRTANTYKKYNIVYN